MDKKIDTKACLGMVYGLSPLPGVLAEVSRLIRSDDATLDDLAKLIRKDPTLVVELIKLSNSSYFGFAERCESVADAVQRLGMREVARMVGVCVAVEVYQKELRHYRIPPEVFWESGIAAALLMERLAGRLGLDTETAYLCGLLRESGMLVIEQGLCEAKGEDSWDCYLPVLEWEREVAGCCHAEMGADLLRKWGFSETVCEAVGQQFCERGGEGVMPQLLRLVNRVLACCGCDFGIPLESCERCAKELEPLGLDGEALLQAVEDAAGAFERLRSSLG